MAVWEVIMVARGYDMDPARTAEHLGWPVLRVRAALRYAESYPEEIEQAIADNESYGFDEVARMLPGTEVFVADGSRTAVAAGGKKGKPSPTAP